MPVPLCNYGSSDAEGALRVDSTSVMNLYIAMWGQRSYNMKDLLVSPERSMQKGFGSVNQDIGSVLARMTNS